MKSLFAISAIACCLVCFALPSTHPDEWGFFGHRLINRKAVFTLPRDMIPFFKQHIDYLTEHAVDPDKRRYATRHEAVRHYIDLDQWGTYPFANLPRRRTEALARHCHVQLVSAGDSVTVIDSTLPFRQADTIMLHLPELGMDTAFLAFDDFRRFFSKHFLKQYYEDIWEAPADSLAVYFGECRGNGNLDGWMVIGQDLFSGHGILPYHLIQMQERLTRAFQKKNRESILRLSADFGHYIGDAHVPLHTTKNYNGQLTDQLGIHAFWESRLPELFARDGYDFFVGQAEYIENPEDWYWQMVLQSHLLVDSTLAIEKRLSRQFPPERQNCYDERLGRIVRTQCREYATAYHAELNGMVERRMTMAVHAIGSAWYTAWVDAGQPRLGASPEPISPKNGNMEEIPQADEPSVTIQKVKARTHEQ